MDLLTLLPLIIFGIVAVGGYGFYKHAVKHTDGTDDIQTADEAQKGLMSSTHATKLATIETNAKDDQTGAEIKALLEALSGANRLVASAIQHLDNLGVTPSAAQWAWLGGHGDIGARVYHNVNQSIPDKTATALAFNSELYDTDGIHDNVTNNSRLTCKTAGRYLISFTGYFVANVTGVRHFRTRLNGASWIGYSRAALDSDGYVALGTNTIYELAVNDYVEIIVYQNSGAALEIQSTAHQSPEFMMQKIG